MFQKKNRKKSKKLTVLSRVKGNDLVTENVLAWSERFRDRHLPCITCGDQVVGGPVLGSTVVKTGLVDLEEGKVTGGDGGAVITSALGEVVDDGTVVRLGPGVPLELDLATSGDGGDLATGSTALLRIG